MRAHMWLLAAALLGASQGNEPVREVSSFVETIDYHNRGLDIGFVQKEEGRVLLHEQADGGPSLVELRVSGREIKKARFRGKDVPPEFAATYKDYFHTFYREGMERGFFLEDGRATHERDIRQCLTQNYADIRAIAALGRICELDWRTIREKGEGIGEFSWSGDDLLRAFTCSVKDGTVTLTIDGKGERLRTGRRSVRFTFTGELDGDRKRFLKTRFEGTILNEDQKIQTTFTRARTVLSVGTVRNPGRVRNLVRAVRLSEEGRMSEALKRYAGMRGRLGSLEETAAAHFGRVKKTAEGIAYRSAKNLDEALKSAKDKPLFLFLDQGGCTPCLVLRKSVLSQAAFSEAVNRNFLPFHFNLPDNIDIARRYNVPGTPTMLILSPDGKELARSSGAVPLQKGMMLLKDGLAAFRRNGKTDY